MTFCFQGRSFSRCYEYRRKGSAVADSDKSWDQTITCFSFVRNGLGQLIGSGLHLADGEQGRAYDSNVSQEGWQVWVTGCCPPLAERTPCAFLHSPWQPFSCASPESLSCLHIKTNHDAVRGLSAATSKSVVDCKHVRKIHGRRTHAHSQHLIRQQQQGAWKGGACLVQLGHDHSGSVFVGTSRAGESEPAHGLVLSGVCCCHVCQAQVGACQGP